MKSHERSCNRCSSADRTRQARHRYLKQPSPILKNSCYVRALFARKQKQTESYHRDELLFAREDKQMNQNRKEVFFWKATAG